MRVKLLIALAIASILLLAGSLPAGAIGVPGVNSINVNVPVPNISPVVPPVVVQPCISFLAVNAPTATTFGPVAPISLCPPAIQASISLTAPCVPGFLPPSFVLPQLSPPVISPFIGTAPILYDP